MGYQYVLGQVEVTSYITPLNPYSVLYQVPEPAITEVGPVSGEVEVSPKVQSQLVQTLVTGITVCNHDDNQQYVYMRFGYCAAGRYYQDLESWSCFKFRRFCKRYGMGWFWWIS